MQILESNYLGVAIKKLLLITLWITGITPVVHAKTIPEYQKECDLGDANGCNYLGVIYIKGQGVTQDYIKAKSFFDKSCKLGSSEGCKKYTLTNSLIGHTDTKRLLHQNDKEVPSMVIVEVKQPPSINRDIPKKHLIKSQQPRLNKIWDDILGDLQEGASYAEKLNSAPDSAWFEDDKEDIQYDINQVLQSILDTLTGDDLLSYKNKIVSLKEKIHKNKLEILTCRENKIGAPDNSTLYTSKSDYDDKIKRAKDENTKYENQIQTIKTNLKKNFSEIGVNLTSTQIDVLLTRVDGDDIIQLSLIMDVIKHITSQIMQLMQESNEELAQAKKYYGMHLISLELIGYIQQKYIEKVNKIYVPKINSIMDDAKKIMTKTESLKFSETNNRRRAIYEKNIEAQKLTYKVSKLYKSDLIKSQRSMSQAQKISKDNLILSKNIFATVLLSADLYELVSESQNMLEEVSKIQVPDIVPFENLQMQKKYKELTGLLRQK